MIVRLDQAGVQSIRNKALARYASIYQQVEEDFLERIQGAGLDLENGDSIAQSDQIRARLESRGAIFRNSDKSIYVNEISPACVACREGIGSATFFVSLKCHRHCYYCFNPNQENFQTHRRHKRDCANELRQIRSSGTEVDYVALTGGEPLLHKQEALEFFKETDLLYPDAHSRLYTAGDFVDEAILSELSEAGLDEIRISIRTEDTQQEIEDNLTRLELAKSYLDSVMVEMPVPPGSFEQMKAILQELDRIGIDSINLLELCFPFHNADEFRKRGFQIKNPPYQIPYNYWYAGGLPIAYSEVECLKLVEYSIEQGLEIGVHYCSLENKHTGQIYQQNHGKQVPDRYHFSERDFYLKTVKVFGDDIPRVLSHLNGNTPSNTFQDTDHEYLEFHVDLIPDLKGLDIDLAISSNVVEQRGDGEYIRELGLDLTRPIQFDPETDI